MEARYQLTPADYSAFLSPRRWRLRWLHAVAACAFVGKMLLSAWESRRDQTPMRWEHLLALAFFALLPVLLFSLFAAWDLRGGMLRSAARAGLLKPLVCRLAADAVLFQTSVGEWGYLWKQISEVTHTSEHLFLHTSKINAEIVPRRAFASAADFELFAEAARQLQRRAAAEAATNPPSPTAAFAKA